jgi:hypothetical protein
MKRFTVRNLMGLILGLALAFAAVRNANDYWAGGMLLGTPLLIPTAAVSAAYHTGRRRAGRLGFAVFGALYFTLTFVGYSHQHLAKLPTSWLLTYVYDQAKPPNLMARPTELPGVPNHVEYIPVDDTGKPRDVASIMLWRRLLPLRDQSDFMVIGHCLCSLLAGLLGTVIAQRYEARQEGLLKPLTPQSAGAEWKRRRSGPARARGRKS